MRKLRGSWVLEIREGEVKEVDDLEQESPAEVRAAPQVNEAELQEIVVREGGCEVGGRGQALGREVCLEERCQVWNLEDVKYDPAMLVVLLVLLLVCWLLTSRCSRSRHSMQMACGEPSSGSRSCDACNDPHVVSQRHSRCSLPLGRAMRLWQRLAAR